MAEIVGLGEGAEEEFVGLGGRAGGPGVVVLDSFGGVGGPGWGVGAGKDEGGGGGSGGDVGAAAVDCRTVVVGEALVGEAVGGSLAVPTGFEVLVGLRRVLTGGGVSLLEAVAGAFEAAGTASTRDSSLHAAGFDGEGEVEIRMLVAIVVDVP